MKITLCGSTRFMDRYNEANKTLTLQGHVVYSVAMYGRDADQIDVKPGGTTITTEDKLILDLVHLQKITESEAIVVIGWRGRDDDYVGDSTRREIAWAMMHGKDIFREDVVPDLCVTGGAHREVLDPKWPRAAFKAWDDGTRRTRYKADH